MGCCPALTELIWLAVFWNNTGLNSPFLYPVKTAFFIKHLFGFQTNKSTRTRVSWFYRHRFYDADLFYNVFLYLGSIVHIKSLRETLFRHICFFIIHMDGEITSLWNKFIFVPSACAKIKVSRAITNNKVLLFIKHFYGTVLLMPPVVGYSFQAILFLQERAVNPTSWQICHLTPLHFGFESFQSKVSGRAPDGSLQLLVPATNIKMKSVLFVVLLLFKLALIRFQGKSFQNALHPVLGCWPRGWEAQVKSCSAFFFSCSFDLADNLNSLFPSTPHRQVSFLRIIYLPFLFCSALHFLSRSLTLTIRLYIWPRELRFWKTYAPKFLFASTGLKFI